jgi:hypothetical protein
MKQQFFAATIVFLLTTSTHVVAQTDVFVCVDEHGKKEYKNTGATKGCKKIDLPNLTMIPAPAKRPAIESVSAKSSAGTGNATGDRPAGAGTPADFPKVDGTMQKARDNDRRQILLDEMRIEEQKLSNLRKEYNNGEPERRGDERNYAKYQERVAGMKEDIGRTEKNIEALKRELNNIR